MSWVAFVLSLDTIIGSHFCIRWDLLFGVFTNFVSFFYLIAHLIANIWSEVGTFSKLHIIGLVSKMDEKFWPSANIWYTAVLRKLWKMKCLCSVFPVPFISLFRVAKIIKINQIVALEITDTRSIQDVCHIWT